MSEDKKIDCKYMLRLTYDTLSKEAKISWEPVTKKENKEGTMPALDKDGKIIFTFFYIGLYDGCKFQLTKEIENDILERLQPFISKIEMGAEDEDSQVYRVFKEMLKFGFDEESLVVLDLPCYNSTSSDLADFLRNL